ncbi:MAG: hypothetical protein LBU23_04515 [Planctomycetota bacterium]|jgi:hypothetical protein|nr:hypothetical protein [Planctomycetota bacterium]
MLWVVEGGRAPKFTVLVPIRRRFSRFPSVPPAAMIAVTFSGETPSLKNPHMATVWKLMGAPLLSVAAKASLCVAPG